MLPLTLNDIKSWLIESKDEYQKLKAQEFPPFDNAVYSMYLQLYEFMEYYPYRHKCDKALKYLKPFLNQDFSQLISWTKANEILGSQQLLMFEINYINWKENVDEKFIKIHEGLYTERKPFTNILCFCKIFQLLYWDNSIHETILTEQEQLLIHKEVRRIFKKYYFDTAHK